MFSHSPTGKGSFGEETMERSIMGGRGENKKGETFGFLLLDSKDR